MEVRVYYFFEIIEMKKNTLPHELYFYAETRVGCLTIHTQKFDLPREGVKIPS